MVCIFGLMVESMMVSGKITNKMDTVFIMTYKELEEKELGEKVKE